MKTVAQNRRARFDYELLETLEAGIVLTGQEVKSCRMGQVSLAGAYISFHGSDPVLKGAMITKYPYASPTEPYEPKRDRRLLLKKNEAERLRQYAQEKGISVVPLDMRAGRFVKLTIGVGRGRKKLDKRRVIREKEVTRALKRGKEI